MIFGARLDAMMIDGLGGEQSLNGEFGC